MFSAASAALILVILVFSVFGMTASAAATPWNGTAASGFASGSGTKDDPYVIMNGSQLAYLAQRVNAGDYFTGKYVALGADIRLNDENFTFDPDSGLVKVSDGTHTGFFGTGVKGEAGGSRTAYDLLASRAGYWYLSDTASTLGAYGGVLNVWTPIGGFRQVPETVSDQTAFSDAAAKYGKLYYYKSGNYTPTNVYSSAYSTYYYRASFDGIFLGSGHTVSGLYVNTAGDYNGIFGSVTGTVYDLNISGSCVRSDAGAGGITGLLYGSCLNCKSSACVISASTSGAAGGIAGSSFGNIQYCVNSGAVCGSTAIGGIAGTSSGSISRCANNGTAAGTTSVGGIVGYLVSVGGTPSLSDSVNNGKVSGSSAVSGIAGLCDSELGKVTVTRCVNNNSYTLGANAQDGAIGGVNGTDFAINSIYYADTPAVNGTGNGAMGISSTQLLNQNTFTSFDFTNIWQMTASGPDVKKYSVIMPFVPPVQTCAHTHTVHKDAVPATCKSAGYTEGVYCNDCEKWISGHETVPMKTEHSFGAWSRLSDDQHTRTCSECGKTETLSHTWNEGTVVKAANCAETGTRTRTCTACGAVKNETIPVSGEHDFGTWKYSDASFHISTCPGCGETKTEAHVWDGGKITKEPTCAAEGVKTYTCTACGGTKTESVPKTDTHTYDSRKPFDAETHEKICSVCGKTETEPHTFDEGKITKQPTCAEEGVKTYTCTVCGGTKNEPVAKTDNHVFGVWEKISDTQHQRTCTVCGKTETDQHGWSAGIVTKEATCGEEGVRTYTCYACRATHTESIPKLTAHTYGEWQKTDDFAHGRVCLVCGKKETAEHVWNKGIVTKPADCEHEGVMTYNCKVCLAAKSETIEKTAHTISEEWYSDATSHYHLCIGCGKKSGTESHIAGPAATETTPQKCTICGYIIRPALGHKHSFATVLSSDFEGHWYACSGCSEQKDFAKHVYDNACDPDCNICGFVRTVAHDYGKWEYDKNVHWRVCKVCGVKEEAERHVSAGAATEYRAEICADCGYVLAPKLPHTHRFEEKWTFDAENHWHSCRCGEKDGLDVHTFDEGVMTKAPTETEDGETTFTCTVCGATYTVPIEKLASDETTDAETGDSDTTAEEETAEKSIETTGDGDETTVEPYTEPDNGGKTVGILIIAGALIVGAVAAWFAFRRER